MTDQHTPEPEYHPLPPFAYGPTPTPEPEPEPPHKSKTTPIGVVVIILLAIVAIVVAISTTSGNDSPSGASGVESKGTRIEVAGETAGCTTTVIEDNGASLSFDTEGEDLDDTSNATLDEMVCWLGALDTPSYIIDKMDSTNSLAGMVSDDWDGYEASWTYHPDNGMDLTIVDTEAVD